MPGYKTRICKVAFQPTLQLIDVETGTVIGESTGNTMTLFPKQFEVFNTIIRRMEQEALAPEIITAILKASTLAE